MSELIKIVEEDYKKQAKEERKAEFEASEEKRKADWEKKRKGDEPFEEKEYEERVIPDFGPGDTVNVHVKIKEGNKQRIQQFKGTVIQRRNPNSNGETFTVRKISSGIGVERIFPTLSPNIEKIEVLRKGKVRRARLFYLRGRSGKAARIKEKK